ncbi:MAG: PH domain-containing protein [Gammaproteobacteria bacterium]
MEVFPITPASAKPLWLLGVICLLLAAIFLALAYTAYSSQRSRVEIHGTEVKLVGDFWGRAIPLHLLATSDAKILDLDRDVDYTPKRRTFGTGLPGYASGWFRLRNGEKALVYLTSRQAAVYIPTSDGYALLLSIAEPETFLETLKRRGLK